MDLQCRISFRGGFSYQASNKFKHPFDHSIHVAGLGCTIMLFLWSLLIQATKQIFDHSTHVTGLGCRIRLAIKFNKDKLLQDWRHYFDHLWV